MKILLLLILPFFATSQEVFNPEIKVVPLPFIKQFKEKTLTDKVLEVAKDEDIIFISPQMAIYSNKEGKYNDVIPTPSFFHNIEDKSVVLSGANSIIIGCNNLYVKMDEVLIICK